MGDEPADAPASRAAERRLILVLLVLYALAYLDRQVISLLIDPIGRDLGVTDVEMGFLQGLGFVLFFALCGPALGWMADRYSRRWIIWGGVTVWSLCTAAGGLADSYTHLLLARFGVGAGEAALLPAAYSMIGDRVERTRLARAMAIFSVGSIIGGALSYGLGGAVVGYASRFDGAEFPLIGAVHSWQLVFLLIGTIGVPLAFAIFAVAEPVRQKRVVDSSGSPRSAGHFARHWKFYLFHICAFSLLCHVAAAHGAWAATYLIRDYHWTVGQVGSVMAGIGLIGGGIGMYGSGMLADWLFRKGYRDAHLRIYVVAAPVMAAAAVLSYLSSLPLATLGGFVVLALGSPFIAVAASALQLGTPSERRGIVSAVFLMVYNIVGFGFGPAVVALVARRLFANDIGSGMALTWVVVTPMIVILMIAGLRPMRRAVDEISAPA